MGGVRPGPIDERRAGKGYVDDGTMVRTRSPTPVPAGHAPKPRQRVVLDGHGTWSGEKLPSGKVAATYTTVPRGTTITFHQKPGERLAENFVKEIVAHGKIKSGYYYEGLLPSDDQTVKQFPWHWQPLWNNGRPERPSPKAFETWPGNVGWQGVIHAVTYGPHELVPNLTLWPVEDEEQSGPGVTVIKVKQETLLSQLLKPNMGDVFWAACQAGHETELLLSETGNDALPSIPFHNNEPRPHAGLRPGQAQVGGGEGETKKQYQRGRNYDPPF